MKARLMLVLAMVIVSAGAFADEVSDALAKAAKLYEAKKYVEAKAEIERALALVTPMAKSQVPEPEIRGRTYVNHEHGFRVTRPADDWDIALAKAAKPGTGGTVPLCQVACTKEALRGDDVAIFYARDLRVFLGPRFDSLRGQEIDFMKSAGKQMASSVKQLEDVQVTAQTEFTLGGFPAVRTDYTCRKGMKGMKCFTVDVLRGHMLFTGMFIGAVEHDKVVAPAFKQILDSVDLSPVAAGAK